MSIARDDRWVADALGVALAGAQVYWCTQPASTTANPPSPLATIYTNSTGTTPLTQPVLTDGFGHAYAYMDASVLYTVVVWHPLFGTNPVVLNDQSIGGGGSSAGHTPAQASTSASTITGTIPGTVFTLPATPVANSLILQRNGQVLTPGLTYSLAGAVITLSTTLNTGENLNANYLTP